MGCTLLQIILRYIFIGWTKTLLSKYKDRVFPKKLGGCSSSLGKKLSRDRGMAGQKPPVLALFSPEEYLT